jgi:hypothetical protein
MKKNFECCYMSVGGTLCLYYDSNIIDDLGNNECKSCEMNNSCEYCLWDQRNGDKPEKCIGCIAKEDE